MMKHLLNTSAIALLFAAAPALAQTSSSQPTPPVTSDTSAQSTMGQPSTYPSTTTGQPSTYPSTTTGQSATYPSTTTGQSSTTTTGQTSTYPSTTGTTTGTTTTTTTDQSTTTTTDQSTMDRGTTSAATDRGSNGPTAPDGTPAFGFKPYFGLLGGYHLFDRPAPINDVRQPRLDGALIEGVAGFNIPIGTVFAGVEGHVARGFGDIRWEYGVRGRAGFRAGDSGLVYASAGYTWTDVLNRRGFPDRKSWMWGLGAEFGPSDIGLGGVTGNAGPRIRISVETADFESIRPMAGVIFHF